jgi:hypothetical protein
MNCILLPLSSRLGTYVEKNLIFYVVFTAAPCNQHIIASTADGRPMTTRMPEIVETRQQQYYQQQGLQQHNMAANSTLWTPTTHEFLRKFA